jgi:hypothetical protein
MTASTVPVSALTGSGLKALDEVSNFKYSFTCEDASCAKSCEGPFPNTLTRCSIYIYKSYAVYLYVNKTNFALEENVDAIHIPL